MKNPRKYSNITSRWRHQTVINEREVDHFYQKAVNYLFTPPLATDYKERVTD